MKSFSTIARGASKWFAWPGHCSSTQCSRSALVGAITRRQRGVKLASAWYCGPDCFQGAVVARVMDLVRTHQKSPAQQRARIPLGLMLHSRGVISHEQLQKALESQRATGSNFGDAVLKLGYASPEQVTSAVAAQWACPVFPIGRQPLATGIKLPKQLLLLCEILPVHHSKRDNALFMGAVSQVQYQVLSAIERMTGCQVRPCFITRREYESHVPASSAADRDTELCFERVMNTGEMANIVRNYAVQLHAEQSRVEICRDYLWARLWGSKGEVDLLFRLSAE